MSHARKVLNSSEMSRIISRVAFEILESGDCADLLLLGVPTRGVHLAHRLAQRLARVESGFDPARCGVIDVTPYRDDLDARKAAASQITSIPCSIDGKTVVLVDDVLSTGRTVRAALDALTALGRPKAVRLAVLIDRGRREFPIRPDHVGKNLPTAVSERVSVKLTETDGQDLVLVDRVNT